MSFSLSFLFLFFGGGAPFGCMPLGGDDRTPVPCDDELLAAEPLAIGGAVGCAIVGVKPDSLA
jgi:hypothetical protein